MSKIIIGLDLSTSNSGYSIFKDKELIKYGSIKPKTTLDVIDRIEYMTREFKELFLQLKKNFKEEEITCVIENIYLGFFKGKNQVTGFANLGRISGAIMANIFLVLEKTAKNIILRNANVARPMVGLKGNCQKAEVQSWVLENFTDIDTDDYQGLIDSVTAEYGAEEISSAVFKKRMGEISSLIENETTFGEDISDAILLGWGETIK